MTESFQALGDRELALCLSGGGLRATLFHFGLIKALRTHKKDGNSALASVREIYSVSGGSIVAAHLVRNWNDYNGDDAQFTKIEWEIVSFCRKNIRDRVIRRSLLTFFLKSGRTHWLQKEYARLVGTGSIAECYTNFDSNSPPMIYILATSFTTGELCSFSREYFEVEPHDTTSPKHTTPAGHLSLAYAVAASSAFPPLFPPIALTAKILRQPKDRRFQETIRLSDGGVFDNLGFEKFKSRYEASDQKIKTLLVSNAGGAFHSGIDEAYAGIVSRNIRASDILMRRVGDITEKQALVLGNLDVVDVRIGADVYDDLLQPATQGLLRLVRTDLDRFGAKLAGMLIDHGYRVGSAKLVERGWAAPSNPPARLVRDNDQLQAAIADRAKDRVYSSFWFDWRDWMVVPFVWLISALIVFLPFITLGSGFALYYFEKSAAAARNQAQTAEFQARLAKIREEEESKNLESLAAMISTQKALVDNTGKALSENKFSEAKVIFEQLSDKYAVLYKDSGIAKESKTGTATTSASLSSIGPADIPRGKIVRDLQVYIFFAGSTSREAIESLNRGLKQAGWQVQGGSGERTALAAKRNEILYSGNNQAAAEALADTLNEARKISSNPPFAASPIQARRAAGPPADALEIWVSR